mmetsp:Transcript_349/g.506  ORF Transcript_349/g.506 Transcript_349/m.506 type:complete len:192 (-) Transcript_349:445-1020(-)|eukprot:CAMPEP_0113653802 /NCGR_PEP_ID=MMETSP0017_2-20120614/28791_1 /TAXON_ID=2856 /ORGANISM="Cylindrotheca closterium" /LENGTH=191 /DNA_ID=CAMNT_0000566855 /DNA_START=401 /DNA_END=976 /DNA_ORIENTATION=- /assembly_acc=CAM_ASM_000147
MSPIAKPVSPQSADAISLCDISCAELEQLRDKPDSYPSFPHACKALLLEMDGNLKCIDCGIQNPEWAAVNYGALVCINCSGKHRSLGVNNSKVRSITMDHWNYDEVVKMLEGGNRQLETFFDRHSLLPTSEKFLVPQLSHDNISVMRYKTKAALFYRQHLDHHVVDIISRGPYKGRRRKRRPLGEQHQEAK